MVGWRVSELDNLWGSVVVSCCSQELVPEAGDSSGTQKKGNIRYGATANKDSKRLTTPRVLYSDLQSVAKKCVSGINPITNPIVTIHLLHT